MGDFDRFKLRHARRIRNHIRGAVYQRLIKDDKKKRNKLRKDNLDKKGYNRPVKRTKGEKEKAAQTAKAERIKLDTERRDKNLKSKRKAKK